MARKKKQHAKSLSDKKFDGVGSRATWRAVDAGTAMAAAFVAPRATQALWRVVTGRSAPRNIQSSEVNVAEALLWAAVAGALTQLIRTAAARAAASYWERSTGETPPKMSKVDPLRAK